MKNNFLIRIVIDFEDGVIFFHRQYNTYWVALTNNRLGILNRLASELFSEE